MMHRLFFPILMLLGFETATAQDILNNPSATHYIPSIEQATPTHQHCRYDSTYTYTFTLSGIDSTLTSKTLYEYDQEGHRTRTVRYNSDSALSLFLNSDVEYEFDMNGNQIFRSWKLYNVDSLMDWDTRVFHYGGDDILDSVVVRDYDFGLQSLVRTSKQIYFYDMDGFNDRRDIYSFDPISDSYSLWSSYSLDYDSDGKLLSEVQISITTNDTMFLSLRSYTAFDSLQTATSFVAGLNGLDTFLALRYAYDIPNNVKEQWTKLKLFNEESYTKYQYNSDKELIQLNVGFQSPTNQYGHETTYQYDAMNCRTHHDLDAGSDPNFSNLMFNSRTYYYLGGVVSSKLPVLSNRQMHLYPNPTKGTCFLSDKEFQYNRALIFDSIGRLKSTQSASDVLHLEGYDAGMYTILFQTNDGVVVRKIVKE